MHETKSSLAILHHLRWLAALAVAIMHLRQNMLLDHAQVQHPGVLGNFIYFIAAYGHAGVVVFFVLSGFLVGGKALRLVTTPMIETEWLHFLIDRFTRIFIVLWPALAISACVLFGLRFLAPQAPFMTQPHWGWSMSHPLVADFSAATWICGAVMLNGLTAPNLTINAPLWSLAYEWFYYMGALGLVLAVRRVFSPAALVIILYSFGLFVLGLLFRPNMIVLGLVWLMGTGARALFDQRRFSGMWIRNLSLVALLGALFMDRFVTVPDLLLGLLVAIVIANRDWSGWNLGADWGEKLANFSYSLYVIHYPVCIAVMGVLFRMGLLTHRLPMTLKGVGIAFGTLVLAILTARAFAFATEDRTSQLRNLIFRLFQLPVKRNVALAVPAK